MSRRPPITTFEGRVAAVTGAASGIGRALAEELARRGAHLALADVDEPGLAETAGRCGGVKVTTRRLDVADRAAVFAWADEVVGEHGRVDLVVNNAGVALAGTVEGLKIEDLEWIVGINFWGVVHGTQAFLPKLKANGSGHIVNLSSVFGLISVPTQAAYNATKFAVRGFTDALRMELEIEGAPVSCTTVHPGGIATNIARSARVDESVTALSGVDPGEATRQFDKVLRTSPETAATVILDGVLRNKRRVLIGSDAKVIDLLARLPAVVYQSGTVAGARMRRGRS